MPDELLTMICESLNKADLKNFRLAYKACAGAAAPRLFRELYFSTIRTDFEVADHVIRQFGPYVRTTLFSSVYLPPLSLSKYRDLWKKPGGNRSKAPEIDYHLRRAYRDYCRLQREQTDDLEKGTIMAYLCSALRALPALEKLSLTDVGAYRTYYDVTMMDRGLPKEEVCTAPGCNMSVKEHSQFMLHPESGFGVPVADPWNMAMLATWSSKLEWKAISMESCEGSGISFPSLTVTRPYELSRLLRNLTELRLDVDMQGQDWTSLCRQRGVGTLSFASQVRILQLSLITDDNTIKYSSTSFKIFFRECQFKNLISCQLNRMDSESEEFLEFLQCSPGLKRLHLEEHQLTKGTWKSVADEIQKSLRLVDIELFSPWGQDLKLLEVWHDPKSVREFFFGNGRNPFCEAAIQDYIDNLEYALDDDYHEIDT